MKKYILTILIALFCVPVFTTHTKAAEDLNDITPYADAKEWRYKISDGKMYKRLYNLSKKRWEGSWIKV